MLLNFRDLLSDRAALYAIYRPHYPASLFTRLSELTRDWGDPVRPRLVRWPLHLRAGKFPDMVGTHEKCTVESEAPCGDNPFVINHLSALALSGFAVVLPRARKHPGFAASLALLVLATPATRGEAQHTGHASMRSTPADTLATAPTTPSRRVADSGAVAESLLKLCKPHARHSIDAYSSCIGDGIASLSSAGNIALAMGTLDYVVHRDPSLVLLGHPLAHALGYAVRSTPATATRLLSQCDDRYQSGCYHGILQRYFDARIGLPIAQKVLLAPCDGLRATREQFRLYDCLHGTGHGLMMYHRYDANASLKDCDRLKADWDQRSCYSGVFMEHNMGARMQTFGDGAFGMHRHSTPAASVVLFKPNDLHYPCDATPARYRRECYDLQADLILPALKQDYRKASKVCDAAGAPDLVRACYAGLGRNASGAAAFQYAGIRKRCDRGSAAGMPFCYQGAVRHLAYAPSELPRGIAFCKSLPDGETRARCWNGVGMQVGGFFSDLPSRQRACRSESAADVSACAEGAGVSSGSRDDL